jgi:hypothetical protein
MVAGTVVGKRGLEGVLERVFALLIEGILVVAGLTLLV